MPDYVDTTGTVHACAGAAKKQGAEIVENNRVLALSQTANGWEVVTEKGAIPPEHVVNAASLRAKQVGRMAGSELPVLPLNHHYLISDTIPELEKLDYEGPMRVDLEGVSDMRQDQKGILRGIYEGYHALEVQQTHDIRMKRQPEYLEGFTGRVLAQSVLDGFKAFARRIRIRAKPLAVHMRQFPRTVRAAISRRL